MLLCLCFVLSAAPPAKAAEDGTALRKLDSSTPEVCGSTQIVLSEETLGDDDDQEGLHTLVIEFREGDGEVSEQQETDSNEDETGDTVAIEFHEGENGVQELPEGIKYVPYSYRLSFGGAENAKSYAIVAGTLPSGTAINMQTGELYGVPQVSGDFHFTVGVFLDSSTNKHKDQEFTLTVLENTDENSATAKNGYEVKAPIGEYRGDGRYVMNGYIEQVFKLSGPFVEFEKLWLDGNQLASGMDYTASEGSTIITIPAETFRKYDDGTGATHTIAAEFRTSDGRMVRTAQNFVIELTSSAPAPSEVVESALPDGIKYVPYSCRLPAIPGSENDGAISCTVASGVLPAGLTLDYRTGKLSGAPISCGTFEFSVTVTSGSGKDEAEYHYTLTVLDNTGSAVMESNDYPITTPIGTPDPADPNHFYKSDYGEETLIIDGPYSEFKRLLIDGKEKRRDIDYTAREGSTVITIFAETFEDTGTGPHTIAAEFQDEEAPDGALKTVAQNYTIRMPQDPGPGTNPTLKPDTQPSVFPFGDVTPADWFYDDVKWAYEEEVMTGETDTVFAPEKSIFQATVVTVLARMASADLTQYDGAAMQDVDPGQWYTEAAIWAKQAGLLPDYSSFTGTGPFSRAQMAVMLVKYLRSLGIDTGMPESPLDFADAALMSADENNAFQVLYRYGIFKGVGNMCMDPAGVTERAQFAALCHRIDTFVQSQSK